jgi:hypothetical protein
MGHLHVVHAKPGHLRTILSLSLSLAPRLLSPPNAVPSRSTSPPRVLPESLPRPPTRSAFPSRAQRFTKMALSPYGFRDIEGLQPPAYYLNYLHH